MPIRRGAMHKNDSLDIVISELFSFNDNFSLWA